MRLRRALMALVASAMVSVIPVLIARCMFAEQSVFEIELDSKFFAVWTLSLSVPVLCWLIILLPLLFFTRFFERRPWYWSGLFGLLIGVSGAILSKVLQVLTGLQWWSPLFIIVWAPPVAIQFMVVSLTQRWAKPPVSASVETDGSGQS